MSLNSFTNQTIALAGISQATMLVEQIATTGIAEKIAFEASIGSVLKIDSGSVIDVFGGLSSLKLGLETFEDQIFGFDASSEQARYGTSLIFLEQELSKQPKLLRTLQIGIEKAQAQAEYFSLLHENVLSTLGDLYHSTISTIQPRIMVNGDEEYLSRQENVNKIRALLLAGIRSALLWRQCGGTKWKFLFYRKKLQYEVQNLLSQV